MGLVVRVVVVLLLLAGGATAGYVATREDDPVPAREPTATPLPASPPLPLDPAVPYAEDIDYPALQPGVPLKDATLGTAPNEWAFRVPEGWRLYDASEGLQVGTEARWRPADEPTVGGYSVRLKVVDDHHTPQRMLEIKLSDLTLSPESFPDFTVLERTDDTLAFTYRAPSSGVLRYNTFRWFTGPDGGEARVEMSVAGRQRDVPGLDDLLARVSASIRPAPKMSP